MTHSQLAELIAQEEGFYKKGSRPARDHNPGDLRAAPHATSKDDAGIAVEPNDDLGWQDLARQISLDAGRGLSLRAFIYKFAPPTENHTDQYLTFVASKLKVSPDTSLLEILRTAA